MDRSTLLFIQACNLERLSCDIFGVFDIYTVEARHLVRALEIISDQLSLGWLLASWWPRASLRGIAFLTLVTELHTELVEKRICTVM